MLSTGPVVSGVRGGVSGGLAESAKDPRTRPRGSGPRLPKCRSSSRDAPVDNAHAAVSEPRLRHLGSPGRAKGASRPTRALKPTSWFRGAVRGFGCGAGFRVRGEVSVRGARARPRGSGPRLPKCRISAHDAPVDNPDTAVSEPRRRHLGSPPWREEVVKTDARPETVAHSEPITLVPNPSPWFRNHMSGHEAR